MHCCALHPVKIDHGHEVNWLSELREVSVLFINLEPGERLNASGTLNLLQSSFDVVYPSLAKYDGRLALLSTKNDVLDVVFQIPFYLQDLSIKSSCLIRYSKMHTLSPAIGFC